MKENLTKYLKDAQATLPNGDLVIGPITTNDDQEFHFVNRHSELDFYVYVKKNDDGWYKSNGQEIETPQSIIDELGDQIDVFIRDNPKLN